jgi:hypothetical protein
VNAFAAKSHFDRLLLKAGEVATGLDSDSIEEILERR